MTLTEQHTRKYEYQHLSNYKCKPLFLSVLDPKCNSAFALSSGRLTKYKEQLGVCQNERKITHAVAECQLQLESESQCILIVWKVEETGRESNKRPTVLKLSFAFMAFAEHEQDNGSITNRPYSLPLCIRLSFYFLNLFPFKMCMCVCVCANASRRKKRVLESGTGITSPCE